MKMKILLISDVIKRHHDIKEVSKASQENQMSECTQAGKLNINEVSNEEVQGKIRKYSISLENKDERVIGCFPSKTGSMDQEASAQDLILKDNSNVVSTQKKPSPHKELHDLVSHNLKDLENKCCFTEWQDVISTYGKQAESNLILEECSSHETKSSKKGRKGNPNAELVVSRSASKRNTGHSWSLFKILDTLTDIKEDWVCRWLALTAMVTLKLTFLDSGKMLVTPLVYAKCDAVDRLELWDNIYSLSSNMNFPWLVGRDFNVILHEEEKIGGLPVHQTKVEDFAFCKNSCDLQDIDFRGSPFTWWNGRAGEDCIFKRLDSILVNNQLQEWLGNLQMEHLSRTGSDHAPLLLTTGEQVQQFSKPFIFLKFWVDHESFLHTVEQHWSTEFVGDAFITFKFKMKKLKAAQSVWSKETFGDIFKQLTIREDIVKIKEQLFEEDPSEVNRMVLQQAQAEFKRYMHFKEDFWKQKAGVKWQSEGDKNTRFFHSLVNGRRNRMQLNRIQNDEGAWLEDRDQISTVAVYFYQQQFSSTPTSSDYSILEHVQEAITQDQNDLLCSMPSLEEVHKAVFELAGDSACGPDGLSGIFYQKCWDIVGVDVYNVVKAFFDGQTLPKSVTHTNLVLLPKKEIINNFSDLRPIGLSNFINKIITRVIHESLESILPCLISQNQSGFVKGRNIIENVLLTQEVVADIRKRGRPANVIIKLDMEKAYDRVSWKYLIQVMKRMGFSEVFVDMIWRILANNWYSNLINGQATGFFHFTKGVNQGDPLSHALFILAAEVLSRALNSLFD
ncbi:uncharacterized protein LOC132630740 [Lycium barbarum]|uniref:uncharacterized protein LOC132630740 n=1 Tax=Lycium barbarum TaxID=112863 RepID=UPI00293F33C4|nr:uncharacterized protein LOC132630740 [Lycium barbarum]